MLSITQVGNWHSLLVMGKNSYENTDISFNFNSQIISYCVLLFKPSAITINTYIGVAVCYINIFLAVETYVLIMTGPS